MEKQRVSNICAKERISDLKTAKLPQLMQVHKKELITIATEPINNHPSSASSFHPPHLQES